jgi:phage antirepressor YoqD-like protein
MSEADELHPVRFVYHHNRYAGVLYDVDGNVLVGETGRYLNVFQEELKDMMVERKVRFMHHLAKEPTYAYFVVSAEQLGRFHIERHEGSTQEGKCYHVYPDY